MVSASFETWGLIEAELNRLIWSQLFGIYLFRLSRDEHREGFAEEGG